MNKPLIDTLWDTVAPNHDPRKTDEVVSEERDKESDNNQEDRLEHDLHEESHKNPQEEIEGLLERGEWRKVFDKGEYAD